ncbi:MAG: ATP-binding protein [Planctomycetes bacterium]|nr:ATP-binding protein [Planctomycetota bacterium]
MHSRQITPVLLADLQKKMVLLAGPRQCGKTTLARQILARRPGRYYNWDATVDRKAILREELDAGARLWVFDEFHKFARWRNWLKGQYDTNHEEHAFLVSGSAKLEIYSRGGDSLQGRYHPHRLHPFTLAEYLGIPPTDSYEYVPNLGQTAPAGSRGSLEELLQFGGFPEPLFAASDRAASRWRREHATRLVREEVRDLERVRELERVELLYERLSEIVGSVLSINNLREDLEVAFETVKSWIVILEKLYACFRLAPYGPPRIKAVRKGQKLYLWDWARVEDPGSRFENFVALHLLRFQHWCEDVEGANVELRYFRNTVGKEVDFVLLKNRKPWIAIEAKQSDQTLSDGLRYLLERVEFPFAFQISRSGAKNFRHADINKCRVRLLPAAEFLVNLP